MLTLVHQRYRALRYRVKQYRPDEVLQILRRRVMAKFGHAAAPEWLSPRLLGLMGVLGYGQGEDDGADAVTLRHVLKLFHRMTCAQAWESFGADGTARTRQWAEHLKLHGELTFSPFPSRLASLRPRHLCGARASQRTSSSRSCLRSASASSQSMLP